MLAAKSPASLGNSLLLRSPGTRLFLLSFVALFLELMVIRWVPSEIRLVAYYANLMLLSSFLGLGIGAILASRQLGLFRWFPLLLALDLVFLVVIGEVSLPGSTGEFRFGAANLKFFSYAVLVVIFLLNAVVFVPIGEQIGRLFQELPVLRAYVWDLAGSIAGTLAFGAFSLLHFSPLIGLALVAALALLVGSSARRVPAIVAYGIALAAVFWSTQRQPTWWSPYYFITIRENSARAAKGEDGNAFFQVAERAAKTPPPGLHTMIDPPLYTVRVNQDFYQMHGSIDLARYTPGSPNRHFVEQQAAQYGVPYHIVKNPRRVLVLGAGGGMDVEAALLRGVEHVDAVEIDPVLPKLSASFNAAAPFSDPRVTVHVADARAFLQQNTGTFDLVVFGHLDSQALFSYGASVRLDGFIYTVEGFRGAFARVAPEGALSISFIAVHEWMVQKFSQMIETATGAPPLVYLAEGTVTFIATKQSAPDPPAEIGAWKLRRAQRWPVDLATDDWPYLYLQKRGIPADYAIAIGTLLVISLGALFGFRGARLKTGDSHFLFLGWGFLLLQTKSIGDCSLYFGTTWVVTMLVITGVLTMVLLANWVAMRYVRNFNFWLYLPLFLSLALVIAVPRELILGQVLGGRVAWTILVVPLPIFFAGLIFSSTFREARQPALALGANLIGATLGGFCEYLGMWIGSQALSLVVIAAYAASLWCMLRQRGASASTAFAAPVTVNQPVA